MRRRGGGRRDPLWDGRCALVIVGSDSHSIFWARLKTAGFFDFPSSACASPSHGSLLALPFASVFWLKVAMILAPVMITMPVFIMTEGKPFSLVLASGCRPRYEKSE